MTQLKKACDGIITDEMKFVAGKENIDPDTLRQYIADGLAVIPSNKFNRKQEICGIGKGTRVKINANIGTSQEKCSLKEELKKLDAAIEHKADTVMDLSTGGKIDFIREKIIERSTIPVGTVPIYQTFVQGDVLDMTPDDFLEGIKKHGKDGVDFITVHSGITKDVLPLLRGRLTGVVSRGGSIIIKYMKENNQENPFYEYFDEIIDIAKRYDMTLSLGDGLRPGCLKDATDKAQIHELEVLGRLTKRAWQEDVQVMIEGPGHLPMDHIEKNMKLQKKLCHNAPFYVLGPLVTDVAPGYDHITAAIGGAIAAYHGADFLCYVTPKEHLGLPNAEDVRVGVIASRIAAHAADITRGKDAISWDHKLSKARSNLDWNRMLDLAMDSKKAIEIRNKYSDQNPEVCTMCGDYCSMKTMNELKDENNK